MSGVITQVKGAGSSFIDDEILFRVEDNGEGFRNTTDRITPLCLWKKILLQILTNAQKILI